MDLDDLALWAAWFADYNPALRDDQRFGIVAATIANCAMFSKGGHEASDFFPSLAPKSSEPMSSESLESKLRAWCANVGGTVKYEKRP